MTKITARLRSFAYLRGADFRKAPCCGEDCGRPAEEVEAVHASFLRSAGRGAETAGLRLGAGRFSVSGRVALRFGACGFSRRRLRERRSSGTCGGAPCPGWERGRRRVSPFGRTSPGGDGSAWPESRRPSRRDGAGAGRLSARFAMPGVFACPRQAGGKATAWIVTEAAGKRHGKKEKEA